MKRKRAVTLVEILIVILLIGLIGGVLAYNFKGSLDKGKEFKSREGAERIRNILALAIAEGNDPEKVVSKWTDFVKSSPLAGRAEQLVKDGFGKDYTVKLDNGDIIVQSSLDVKQAS